MCPYMHCKNDLGKAGLALSWLKVSQSEDAQLKPESWCSGSWLSGGCAAGDIPQSARHGQLGFAQWWDVVS